jgi:hypothetical protein
MLALFVDLAVSGSSKKDAFFGAEAGPVAFSDNDRPCLIVV